MFAREGKWCGKVWFSFDVIIIGGRRTGTGKGHPLRSVKRNSGLFQERRGCRPFAFSIRENGLRGSCRFFHAWQFSSVLLLEVGVFSASVGEKGGWHEIEIESPLCEEEGKKPID